MKRFALVVLVVSLAISPLLAGVEDRTTDSKTFPAARLVIVDNINGNIEASGYNGNDLVMEVTRTVHAESAERLATANREVKLNAEQSSDTVKLFVDAPDRCNCENSRGRSQHEGYTVRYDFKLRVPAAARVDLYTVNAGKILVNGIAGDFDIKNVNGEIEMNGVAGSGQAHTVNGPVKVVFLRNPTSSSSFETVNGNVDLAFLNGLSADVRMQTLNGGMYTDFEVTAAPEPSQPPENRGGKFVYHRGGATRVRIGAGGIAVTTKTLNGNIYIRNQENK
ncbi:MAG TPA: hypothetical protein VKG25_25225 [Bryobacteraceae bacterium]|nr:hypothetical protein [Bryobacteraceae bacterium]